MTMKSLLYPLLVQVALTFAVMFRMYAQRVGEMQSEKIRPQEISTRSAYLARLRSSAPSADNFSNQFEMPVLFYTAVILAVSLLVQDVLLVLLAWVYVGLRIVHAAIHVTYNDVMHRFYAFAASAFVLLGIWVRLGALIVLR